MKLLTDKQLDEHWQATIRGTVEGTAGGVALAGLGHLYAKRRFPGYRTLPPSLKLLGAIIIVAPCLAIQGERRGLEYDRSQWEGEGLRILDQKELMRQKEWDAMSLRQKVGDWSMRHQYTLIMGGWAGSLGAAAAIISRNKYQTYAQKIVQARMWAQGLTIGLLIVAGALTANAKKDMPKDANLDHSWKDVLEQQERDRAEAEEYHRKAAAGAVATASS